VYDIAALELGEHILGVPLVGYEFVVVICTVEWVGVVFVGLGEVEDNLVPLVYWL
jgi:hypothetical protein